MNCAGKRLASQLLDLGEPAVVDLAKDPIWQGFLARSTTENQDADGILEFHDSRIPCSLFDIRILPPIRQDLFANHLCQDLVARGRQMTVIRIEFDIRFQANELTIRIHVNLA